MKFKASNSGQILLVVVLSMVVALTVGLSIASRTISNLKISKQNEESQRAFQAAEAGLEQAIQKIQQDANCSDADGCTVATNLEIGNNSKITTNVESVKSNDMILNGGDDVGQAVGIDVWMSDYPNYSNPYIGQVRIFWGNPGQDCSATGSNYPAAIEVLLIYGADLSTPQLLREVFDPCRTATNRIPGAIQAQAGGKVQGRDFAYSAVFPSSGNMSNGRIFKVIPIYNSTPMGIQNILNSPDLPAQGSVIESTGKSGDTVRKIQYFQSYPQIPNELFPYSIVSQ